MIVKFIKCILSKVVESNKAEIGVGLRLVQDEYGNDIDIRCNNVGRFSGDQVKAWLKEGERVLTKYPHMIPLFQAGTILEVGVDQPYNDPNSSHKVIHSYIGIQIAGVRNKNPKDKRRDFGMMGLSHMRTKDQPFYSFGVRLRLTGVPG
jgi:hypothetical protein